MPDTRSSATPSHQTPSYQALLHRARALGHADGLLAAELEPADGPALSDQCCRGREPAEFARLLWGSDATRPPSGLEVNAPLWYAQGFGEALADARARRIPPPRAAAEP
jgi:hypothetical protein